MKPALLDTSVLIALFDADHVRHRVAHEWLERQRVYGWATCPIVENGCVRIMSLPRYPVPKEPSDTLRRMAIALRGTGYMFWADDISLHRLDASRISCFRTSGDITDGYLLALARRHDGVLATLDQRLATNPFLDALGDTVVIL